MLTVSNVTPRAPACLSLMMVWKGRRTKRYQWSNTSPTHAGWSLCLEQNRCQTTPKGKIEKYIYHMKCCKTDVTEMKKDGMILITPLGEWLIFFFSPQHVNVKGSTSLILHSVHHMQTQTPHWYLASVGRQCSTTLYDVLYCFQKVYVEWFWGRGGAHES